MISFFNSTIGKKIIVAVTGVILFGFVVVHMIGNLQIFEGPEKINVYGAFLKREAAILWGARLFLLTSVLLHIIATVQLTLRNRQSRPIGYVKYEPIQANAASRTMIWGGLFLMCFIIFHLLHFTVGSVHPHFNETDIYSNVITGFQVWYVSIFYIAGMLALGMHLYHGVFSFFQTLGLNHPSYNPWKKRLAIFSSIAIPLGYISIPAAVLAGILR